MRVVVTLFSNRAPQQTTLQRSLGPFQFFTIGFGAILGVAWAIVLGDWLAAAAPLGALIGFVCGGLAMLLIAACYAELATVLPRTGGDIVYAFELFGSVPAFFVGWFLVLMGVAMTSFEAISLAWLADAIFPGHQGYVVYSMFGQDIRIGALVLGAAVTLIIGAANYLGSHSSSRLQDLFTCVKASAVIAFVIAAWTAGTAHNLLPLTQPTSGRPLWVGALWIAATGPVWYGGFQIVPQGVEERRAGTSLRMIGWMTLLSVAAGIVFYCSVILAAAFVFPWKSLVTQPLPATAAIRAAFHDGAGSSLVLGAIVLGILATWNACFIWSTRVLVAMGRMQLAPPIFAATNRYGGPKFATYFVILIGLIGVSLGRGAIEPIVSMAAIALAGSYFLSCWTTLKLRHLRPDADRPFRVPGGTMTLRLIIGLSAAMALVSLIEPAARGRRIPLEWILLLIWAAAGAVVWHVARKRPERRL